MGERPPLAVLRGVRVLSFTQFLLGPSGVQFLADLGGDVVKIEPPGGTLWERNWSGADLYLNGVSAFFLLAHRNQRSLTLDLKKPEGLAVARRLVEGADVLVQNFRPGVMERLGLGWEAVRALNPRLIYVSASGYGQDSPYRDRPGQDLLMQAISGLALWRPAQLSILVTLLGGFQGVRIVHFAAMCALLAFLPGHLLLVALSGWRSFSSMLTGFEVEPAPRDSGERAKS